MNAIRRVNPRRPHTVTPAGIKRIVLEPIRQDEARSRPSSMARKPLRTDARAARSMLAVAHAARGHLDAHARQAVAAAALLAGDDTVVHALIFGTFEGDAAQLGADTLTVLPACTDYAPDTELAVLLALMDRERPEHVFLPDNGLPDGDLGRRLAAATRATVATQVVELGGGEVASRYQCGARMLRRAMPRIVLLAPDAVDERLPFLGQGVRVTAAPLLMGSAYRDHGIRTLPPAEVGLEEADLIVSAGNGVQDLEGFLALANALGAAVGASRVAVDDGRFDRSQQIGATGKSVSASAYLAFGISGAVQHLQGIKDCRHVIAVNLDASAPLIRRADLSIIDDAQRVAQALLAEVRQARAVPGHAGDGHG